MTVSMVFVSTNETEVLIPALESLFAEPTRHDVQVVVIDNASTDDVVERVAAMSPDIKVITREQNYGLPANLNLGITNSNGEYVMLCNSDLIFKPGSVDALADFLDSHPTAGMVAPRLMSPDDSVRVSARRWYTFFVLAALKGPWQRAAASWKPLRESVYEDWDFKSARSVDWVPCPATMVRRAAFEQVGLMDERFRLYFDDVDISLRMHEAGWEVWCEPRAEIVHLEQRSSVRPLSKAWRWHLSSLVKFWWKHKGLKPRRSIQVLGPTNAPPPTEPHRG
ncbi:MAG: glycosyltransferase family 2 protein [Actinomycetota bacterium]